MKVSIIGTGNVAWHLNLAFYYAGVELYQVFGRNKIRLGELTQISNAQGITDLINLKKVDIIIIAVSDDSISEIVSHIPAHIRKESIIAHTSGTKSILELTGCSNPGIFYPLQTFTRGVKTSLEEVPICLNGEKPVVQNLRKLASHISKDIRTLTDSERKQTHLSAVMINNFTNHLIYLAKERLDNQGITGDILDPLLKETVRKQALLSPFDAQTGPARRGDHETMDAHLRLLADEPELAELYHMISKSIMNLYK